MKRYLLTILVLFIPITTLASDEQADGTRLKGKNIVMVVPERLFHESTFEWLNEILIREGAEVIIASNTLSGAYGAGGMKIKPDILIKNISTDDLDVLVFLGGAGCLQYLSDYMVHEIAKQASNQGKIIAAIHLGTRILAEAGLLTGKKVTCTSPAASYLKDKGAIVTGKDVERDGNIITSVGPSTAKQFGETIVTVCSE